MLGRRRDPVEVTRLGRYELRVEVLHAGTRSQGRVGRLFLDGSMVLGRHLGETIAVEADPRVLVFLGDERPHLWAASGWALQDQSAEEA